MASFVDWCFYCTPSEKNCNGQFCWADIFRGRSGRLFRGARQTRRRAENPRPYVYLNDDDSLLCFRSSSIYYMNEAHYGGHVIYGDFADLCAEMGTEYQKKLELSSTFDWGELAEGTTAVTDEQYSPYTGTFVGGEDKPRTMQSEFRQKDGQICWFTSMPMDLTMADVTVHQFFTTPSPVADMTVTETYDTVTATVTFVDGSIHMLLQDGDTVIYDELFTKEA